MLLYCRFVSPDGANFPKLENHLCNERRDQKTQQYFILKEVKTCKNTVCEIADQAERIISYIPQVIIHQTSKKLMD